MAATVSVNSHHVGTEKKLNKLKLIISKSFDFQGSAFV